MKATADEAVKLAPSVEKLVVVPRLNEDIPWHEGRDVWWKDLMTQGPEIVPTEQTASDEPIHDHQHLRNDGPAKGHRA